MLSLKLLAAAAVAGLVAAAFFFGIGVGRDACNARWLAKDAARIEAERIAIEKRDARLNRAKDDERQETRDRLAELERLRIEVEGFEDERNDDRSCVLDGRTAERLRNLR